MNHPYKYLSLLFICLFYTACEDKKTIIKGNIDYIGQADLILETSPVHYKYAPVQQESINIQKNGDFSVPLISKEQEVKYLILGDERYPVVLTPGNNLSVSITRSEFPQNITVSGYPYSWDQQYESYLKSTEGLDKQIEKEEENFKLAEKNAVIELSKKKYELAKKYLRNTPLENYYHKAIGEYLVIKIRSVEYKSRFLESYNADSARNAVLKEADHLNFFSSKSLQNQRAGIRDFTHYYARTFGIYDSVKTKYGIDLAEYDIKKLAYQALNKKRLEVLKHIQDRPALAHAKMYLVAERIGEQDLETARPSYQAYLKDFSDFPEYTNFLTYFYNEIKSVSPGQPAVSFSIPDIQGTIHTMKEYDGKYVLLDFWAGWCQPCLDEFPYMKNLYTKYSRKDFEIVGISNEVDSLIWVQDITRFKNPWPQLYGGNGFDQEIFKAYKGGGIPFYILINRDGNIQRYNDIRPSFNLESVLDSLIISEN